jgi:hypothetical protein
MEEDFLKLENAFAEAIIRTILKELDDLLQMIGSSSIRTEK